MTETIRLSGCSEWIDLDFVERERTPRELMELGIRLHLAVLSLSNTVKENDEFGVEYSRKAVHDWVQKADLQPADEANPAQVALDETVIRINGHQYWLYAAVDPATNLFLHVRLFAATTTALIQRFLRELRELRRRVSRRLCTASRSRTPTSRAPISARSPRKSERRRTYLSRTKQRTSSFSNSFSHVDPETAETWLQAFAVWWNSRN